MAAAPLQYRPHPVFNSLLIETIRTQIFNISKTIAIMNDKINTRFAQYLYHDSTYMEPKLYLYLYTYLFFWNFTQSTPIIKNSVNAYFTIIETHTEDSDPTSVVNTKLMPPFYPYSSESRVEVDVDQSTIILQPSKFYESAKAAAKSTTPAKYYFVKLVKQDRQAYNDKNEKIDGQYDHPILDAVNGSIVNSLANLDESIKPYVMTFIDAFQTTFTPSDKNNPNGIWNTYENCLDMPQTIENKGFDGYACISNYIEGRSVADIILPKNPSNDDPIYANWINLYSNFYQFLITFGCKYGMMHNDLYLANIYYDLNTKSLKLIDYGRMYFQKYIDEPNIDINNFVKLYHKKLWPSVSNQLPNLLQPEYTNFIQNMGYFYKQNFNPRRIQTPTGNYVGIIGDIITLTCNLFRFMQIIPDKYGIDILKYNYAITDLETKFPVNIILNNDGNIFTPDKYVFKTNTNFDEEYIEFEKIISVLATSKIKDFYISIYEGMLYLKILLLFYINNIQPEADLTSTLTIACAEINSVIHKVSFHIMMEQTKYEKFLEYFILIFTTNDNNQVVKEKLFGLKTMFGLPSSTGGRKKSRRGGYKNITREPSDNTQVPDISELGPNERYNKFMNPDETDDSTQTAGKRHHNHKTAPVYKKTPEKHENRCIYVGARGGKYVKCKGEFVSLKKFLSKASKTPKNHKK